MLSVGRLLVGQDDLQETGLVAGRVDGRASEVELRHVRVLQDLRN